MNASDIAGVLVKAKRYVPESARAQLCYMFAYMIGDCLKQSGDANMFEIWKNAGAPGFLKLCELEAAPLASVRADIRVQESLLSEFCNKWMNVTQFRQSDGDWTPITADMNSLRVTMVRELEELANAERQAHNSTRDSEIRDNPADFESR